MAGKHPNPVWLRKHREVRSSARALRVAMLKEPIEMINAALPEGFSLPKDLFYSRRRSFYPTAWLAQTDTRQKMPSRELKGSFTT